MEVSLMTVLINLEVINLRYARLTKDQLQTLFIAIGEGSNLKGLELWNNNLSNMEVSLMTVLINLEDVNLSATSLTRDQLQTLFIAIWEGTKLKNLDLSVNKNVASIHKFSIHPTMSIHPLLQQPCINAAYVHLFMYYNFRSNTELKHCFGDQ